MTRSPARLVALLASSAALVPALVLVSGAPAQAAAVYRVSPYGSDSADGIDLPWLTIRNATSVAPAGATIVVESGTYDAFVVTRPDQTVTAAPGHEVVVTGHTGVQNVVLVEAPRVTLEGLTVTGCVPDPVPPGDFGDAGSAAIRIDDGATGATVREVTIEGSQATNNHGLPFGCYGILVHGADEPTIVENDISGTGTAIYLNGGGQGAMIADNRIHDNDVLIRNTPGGDDDYGANGVVFANVRGPRGALATRNSITGSTGPSSDYEFDGGAFEIFDSSNVRMISNSVLDNENVLETGSSPDRENPQGDCVGNEFVDNDARGRVSDSELTRSIGLILRCATGMVVSGNRFTDFDYFVYYISDGDDFASNVDGLVVQGNMISQFQKVYHLDVDPEASGIKLDGNRIHFPGPVFASYGDGSTSPTIAGWQSRSGQDRLTTTT